MWRTFVFLFFPELVGCAGALSRMGGQRLYMERGVHVPRVGDWREGGQVALWLGPGEP